MSLPWSIDLPLPAPPPRRPARDLPRPAGLPAFAPDRLAPKIGAPRAAVAGAGARLAAWQGTVQQARALPPGANLAKLGLLVEGLARSGALWRNVPPGSPPGGPGFQGNPYVLDAMRTPAQIMAEGRGGECGSYAKVLADALIQAGASPDDVFLVDTVGECLRAEATRAAAAPGQEDRADATGHAFVLVRDARDGGWALVNPTAERLEAMPFMAPRALQARLAAPGYAATPVHVRSADVPGGGAFPSLLSHLERAADGQVERVEDAPAFADLVPFYVTRAVDYAPHTYAARVRAIAAVVPAR